MVGEAFPSPFSVLGQRGIEQRFEVRGRGGRANGQSHGNDRRGYGPARKGKGESATAEPFREIPNDIE